MAAQIIFLHGASSSGKSTIARALQARIETPFWHISIDHLRDSGVLPMERFKAGHFRWADVRQAFFDGFHASLGAYARAGNNLILEHIIDDDAWMASLRKALYGHDVFFAGIHCRLELLVQREIARGNRPLGSAKKDFETIHVGRRYDLELNSEDGLAEKVETILSAWRSGQRTSEFQDASTR